MTPFEYVRATYFATRLAQGIDANDHDTLDVWKWANSHAHAYVEYEARARAERRNTAPPIIPPKTPKRKS